MKSSGNIENWKVCSFLKRGSQCLMPVNFVYGNVIPMFSVPPIVKGPRNPDVYVNDLLLNIGNIYLKF